MVIGYYSIKRNSDRELLAVRDCGVEYTTPLDKPENVVVFLEQCFEVSALAEERVYMICYSGKCPVAVFQISSGSFDCAPVDVKNIFSKALLVGATSILLSHNHPSLDTSPSKEDVEVQKRVKEVGVLLGIELLDFIVTGDGYFSFKEKEML